ncbi:MAG: methyltransferase family protein [bacterium]
MKRYLDFSFSLFAYVLSVVALTFLIFWVYPWGFMPYYIDKGSSASLLNAVLIDSALLLLFALQHSLMARDFFKEAILNKCSFSSKASIYGVASSLALIVLFCFWQPINSSNLLWNFKSGTILFWLMSGIYVFGWVFAFIATFLIDHFELFGLHQGYRAFKGLPEPEFKFQTKLFYKYVRHPIQLGTLIGLWVTPSMSYGHLFLSFGLTLYIFIGLYYEEKSLVKTFGDKYRQYQKEVPLLIPFI